MLEICEIEEDSKMVAFAKEQLAPLYASESELDKDMADNVLNLVRVYESQGHSSVSGAYCLSLFNKLARMEKITFIEQ